MIEIKEIEPFYRSSSKGYDGYVVRLKGNIDDKLLFDSFGECIYVPTQIGTLKFNVRLNKDSITLTTSNKDQYNDTCASSSSKMKECIYKYIDDLNRRMAK